MIITDLAVKTIPNSHATHTHITNAYTDIHALQGDQKALLEEDVIITVLGLVKTIPKSHTHT